MVCAFLVLVVLLCRPSIAQLERAAESSTQQIGQAAQQLSSPKFHARERAARDLWKFGEAARPQLERVANGSDSEARRRARTILRNFDYGVLPTTPEILRDRILQFREGIGHGRRLVEHLPDLLQGMYRFRRKLTPRNR